jgi:erythromycin esterase-like protein
MAEDGGLGWKDGAFYGFDDYMKNAKAQDASLYQTAEEKEAAAKAAEQQKKAPVFTGPVGDPAKDGEKTFTPPKIF